MNTCRIHVICLFVFIYLGCSKQNNYTITYLNSGFFEKQTIDPQKPFLSGKLLENQNNFNYYVELSIVKNKIDNSDFEIFPEKIKIIDNQGQTYHPIVALPISLNEFNKNNFSADMKADIVQGGKGIIITRDWNINELKLLTTIEDNAKNLLWKMRYENNHKYYLTLFFLLPQETTITQFIFPGLDKILIK